MAFADERIREARRSLAVLLSAPPPLGAGGGGDGSARCSGGRPLPRPRLGPPRRRHPVAQRRKTRQTVEPPLRAVRHLDRDAVPAEAVEQRRCVLDRHPETGRERRR